ncbi:MAG: HAD-IA family hydrolase [Novosphingobium sp.]|nr:HAD-IA family hydrolase [Novosphingobium sp.]MBO9601356.1 HAD-IA family hydrolase [Novosphingobium sp.]
MDCIVFDLDGTLVDSEQACNRALLDLLPDLTDDLAAMTERNRGRRFALIRAEIETRLGRTLPADFEPAYRARLAEIFGQELRAMPGAHEMLAALELPICVASSGPSAKIRHALELTGLAGFFGERLFSSYDIGSWKPDPGLFLHAAERMGFAPAGCLVVEDSAVGVAAGMAAGMRVVHYLPAGGEAAPGATAIGDLRELVGLVSATADRPQRPA